jgi:serine/threonine-protein kinase HipA
MAVQKEIYVYAHWQELHAPTLMGVLHVTPARGKEIFSFEYDRAWIDAGHKHTIDPDLQFYTGQQYLKEEKNNFGIFLDSSPDRWGRVLMRRREAAEAKLESRKPKTLLESDYLLGVFDAHRMGAIRFKESMDGAFQHDHKEQAAPPWANLRELEHASLELEKENSADDPEYMKWLNMLIAPGASLGGARPKASILDLENNLWFAKFPSATDDKDVGAWEMVVHDLAIQCKINMSTARIQKFSSNHHTYLTKRFDRTAGNQRIHFASAMTLLGYTDGTDYNDGVSYLELAEFIMKQGAKPDQDLEELWRRIVFSICVKNTDDHLRNHGFLLTDMGWLLSPAYDINPVETGTGLTLNISEVDNALDLNLAREVAVYFRLNNSMANKIIEEVKSAVKNWPLLATKYGISREEQSMMSPAFENGL